MSCSPHRILRNPSLLSSLRPTATRPFLHLHPSIRATPAIQHPSPPRWPCHHLTTSRSIPPSYRLFSSSAPNRARTIQQANARARSGPFSARAAIVFLVVGAGLIVYFRFEKERMDRKRIADASKGVGKPLIGGPFELIDQEGVKFESSEMKGGFSIVYFGFTHCPDICPEELDKLAKIIDLVADRTSYRYAIANSAFRTPSTSSSPRQPLLPLFITCDPARDSPAVLKSYLQEFHPGIVGLTGTWEQVRDMCKKYRVYFSTPEGVKPNEDYLVDHSIYFYVMDPDGDFIEAIGRQHSPESAAEIILAHMSDWRDGKKIA